MSLKRQKVTLNVLQLLRKKNAILKIQYICQIIYINQGHLPAKVTNDTDFTDGTVVQYDVLVVKNTFVDDCK